jgi:SM-20-related protein
MISLPQTRHAFLSKNFVDELTCAEWCSALLAGNSGAATVANATGDSIIDSRTRRAICVSASSEIQREVQRRFVELAPKLQHYFGVRLSAVQAPQFLRYQRGDFFRPHRDDSTYPGHPHELRSRKVSVVLFLNACERLPRTGAYSGGQLRLYTPDSEQSPFLEICGEAGLLIGFKSDVLHEVRPVTHGERFTVVTWYEGRSGEANG